MYSQDSGFLTPSGPKSGYQESRKKWYQRWWGRLIIVFLAIFLALLTAMGFYVGRLAFLLRSGELTPQELFGEDFVPTQSGQKATLATSDDPSLGPRDAKVIIVEFADFQCPYCKEVQPVIKEILRDYGDKILFIYRDFPLADSHPQALMAAIAGQCAHEQGKFWEMHDKIFANQAEITEVNLKTYAVQIGLNSIQFGSCLQSEKYLSEIEEDWQAGYDACVRGAPTFFINGYRLAGVIPFNTFEQIIVSELSR